MDNYFNDLVKNISDIVKIPSFQQPAQNGMPFGKDCADALAFFLNLAKEYGFETVNYDNYVGEVVFGSGEEFAVLAHLDVVTAGSGWNHEPFGGEIDEANKKIWGRGTMDDKGPAIIALIAMKALKDEGFTPNKKIKLIVGCNEETGWGCIEHYNQVAHMPETGFSPDANFPVIYAEKGIMHVKLRFKTNGGFTGLKGGELANMVCDFCEVEAAADSEKLKKYNLSAEGGKIISRGKSAHGSTPDEGVNAIDPVLKYLGLEDIYELLFVQKLGMADFEDETGKLTLSPDIISQDGDNVYITCDIRYPATYSRDKILQQIDRHAKDYEILHDQLPLFNDKQCTLIKTLCEVYNEVTGKNLKPIAIGGGTYARALKCGAAFGPEEDGEENTIHQANEYITFEKIEKCFKIYKLALKKLTA